MKFVIVTGMSGAGRNTAMKMMEDIGFYCIDNLPIQLLEKLVELSSSFHSDITDVAVGIDARNAEDLSDVPRTLELLKQKNIEYKILYLDADDDVLVKRYKETRRNHPLAAGERIEAGITLEKSKLTCIKAQADYIIDTSRLLTRELKEEIKDATNIIVAQRIGTIIHADKIIVLDNGKKMAEGTHKELLKKCKVYKEIALSQLSEEELKNA